MKKKFLNIIKNWSELYTLPVAVLLWWAGGVCLRLIDETAGIYDIGILQAFLLGTVGILFGHTIIWLILKLSVPYIYETLDNFIVKNQLTPWQKGLFSLFYFSILLLVWGILVSGMS